MDSRIKPEIFKQRVPCLTCPFRKDAEGERHSPEMVASYISYFLHPKGATFPCHKSVTKDDPRTEWSEWQDGQVLCAGGLIFAAKMQRRNALVALAEREGWYSQLQHTPEERALVFDSAEEMLLAADWDDER